MPSWLTDRDQGPFDGALLQLIDTPLGPLAAVVGLLLAVGVGAAHALAPGHGKALVGAYLAGSRGRARDAVALGAVVATMHTGSVLVLGFGFYATQEVLGGGRLEPVLTLISAAAVVGVGVYLVVTQLRALRVAGERSPALVRDHDRDHGTGDVGDDDQGHDDHGHGHEALPPGVPPLSRAGVVALASSGGLLPSPAAFLVLATSLAVGRAGYGLALVAAFSVGLAATLTAIGLAVLWGRDAATRRWGRSGRLRRLVRLLPLAAGVAVTAGGLLIGAAALLRL